jgi:hypothetical protein
MRWIQGLLFGALLSTHPVTTYAQSAIKQSDLRAGAIVYQTQMSGAVDPATRPFAEYLLPAAHTVSELLWEVSYSITRTKTAWPYWDAAARIDVLSADGQCLGRIWARTATTTVTGNLSFFGDTHPQARPHKLRVTFIQGLSFPFSFGLKCVVRRCRGANIGGTVRQQPLWMGIGSAEEPSWMCGDMRLGLEECKSFLFHVRAGQTLCGRFQPKRSLIGTSSGMKYLVYGLDHVLKNDAYAYTNDGQTYDTAIYTNRSGAAEWVIVSLAEWYRPEDFNLGFYSPEGPTPAAGEVLTPPTVAQLNPYTLLSFVQTKATMTAGTVKKFAIGATGRRLRLRVRLQKTPFLGGGSGTYFEVRLKNSAGVKLTERFHSTDPGGHEPEESFYDIEFPAASASVPSIVEITTRYANAAVVLETERSSKR